MDPVSRKHPRRNFPEALDLDFAERPRGFFTRELFPVAGGEIGFGMLLVLMIVHVLVAWIGPDESGRLFRAGVVVEAVGSSLLVIAPVLVTYAGLRSAIRDRDSFLPYLCITGGGFLSTLTFLGLYLAL